MNPQRNDRSLSSPSPWARGGMTAGVMLLIPLLVLVGGDGFRDFLNFGAGVLSLVSLTCSVIWGLVATDRLFLNTRQRLVAQAIHRTTAVGSIAFLLLHITVKIALDHASLLAAVIPFGLGVTGSAGLIGFGPLAALLMVTTGMTGALRSAFASPAPVAARWRAVHTLAYPAWCSALVHGLFAGRPAKTWVVVMYSLCLLAVLGAIALRAAPQPFKRRVAAQVLALLSPGARGAAGRERPSRRDAAAAPLPGANASLLGEVAGVPAQRSRPPQEPRMPAPSPPLYEAPAPPSSVPSANASASAATGSSASSARPTGAGLGMAAAYRAVSMPPPPFPEELPGTFPDDFRAAESTYAESQLPLDLQPTETLPRMDDGSGTGRWPTPSPPPPAEAPPSAYDPLTDTLYGGTATYPAYNDSYDPYANYGDNPAADPLTDPLTGPFQAPSSGEPWNAPTGGRK